MVRPSSTLLAMISVVGPAIIAACSGGDDATASAGAAATAPTSAAVDLTPMDLSILFPLTAKDFDAKVLRPSDSGKKGTLLPDAVIKKLRPLAGPAFENAFGDLRTVAVRIDPCANIRTAKSDAECLRQVRIVWQSAEAGANGGAGSVQDFNVHGIYTISDADFRAVVKSIQAVAAPVNASYAKLPLQPHPAILAQGMSGPYATAVLDAMRMVAGEQTMTQAAFVAETDQSTEWTFAAMLVRNGSVVQLKIPTLSSKTQKIREGLGPPLNEANPTSREPDQVMTLLGDIAGDPSTIPREKAEQALRSTLRIENPSLHDALTMDCGSCHLATVTRLGLTDAGVTIPQPNDGFASQRWNLDRISEEHPAQNETLQMFSYTGGDAPVPSIRQRVINESAVVADYVNAHFK